MSGERRIDASRMGIDLAAAWAEGERAAREGRVLPRPSECGGALLYLSRAEAWAAQHGGIQFQADPGKLLPEEGRNSIRVVCRRDVFVLAKGERRIVMALCEACSGLEKGNREYLAKIKVQRDAEESAKRRREGKKRGFAEEAG